MRLIICATAALALFAYSGNADAKAKAAPAAKAAFQLNETTWLYTGEKGTKVRESIDSDGNFIVQTRTGKHLDHGTAVMKGNKACFTSAMTKEGEICWSTSPVKIGHSLNTVSDKGEKLKVTRVAYVKMSMPK
ncbi:MAG TPA: hypothetical protein VHS33_08620 [Sphingomicrobium sp.]|jgi:hypothetical protein|nr:hypothetical protein [Sphingomicrobium sp.]